jgi:butyryl-CoA dehydrogenase
MAPLPRCVGFAVISKVPNTLHTSLISGTNAIHRIFAQSKSLVSDLEVVDLIRGRPVVRLPDASLLLSRADLEFQLYDWLDVEELFSRPRYEAHSRATAEAMVGLAETLAREHFAPHNKINDIHEPGVEGQRVRVNSHVGAALKVLADSGLAAAAVGEELGGAQVPYLLYTACFSWLHAANVATASYPLLTMANANLLIAHGSPDQIETFARPMLEGRFYGTMALSEPDVGSSLADIATRAEPAADGSYRLIGNKMWISGGDHELGENIVHLVLARVVHAAPGAKGLSLFVVPKYLANPEGGVGERNDIALVSLNHKMGWRGTTNTLLSFGTGTFNPAGQPGAIGYLIGEENQGLFYMFHMMNEVRVGLGATSAALGYTGYLKSLEYAKTRVQGRPDGRRDQAVKPVSIIHHPDVRRMLLAQKAYVEAALGLVLYCAKLVDEQRTAAAQSDRQNAELLLAVLTPIAKSWPAQWCVRANDLAIQVLGGYGYSREYDVEQHYRDNRLNAIHEGTHGIQARDLLGRKVVMAQGAGLELLADRIRTTIAHAAARGGETTRFADQLTTALVGLLDATEVIHQCGDERRKLANASIYLETAGHIVAAWIWLEQYLVCVGKIGEFYEGKRLATRFFYRYELPRVGHQLELLRQLDTLTVEMQPAWL